MAFRWWADDDPPLVAFGSSLPSLTDKKLVGVGPPLAKLSGSARELIGSTFIMGTGNNDFSIFIANIKTCANAQAR